MFISDSSAPLSYFQPLFERYPSAPFFFRGYQHRSFCLAADIDEGLMFVPSLEYAVQQGYDQRYKEESGSPCSGARGKAAELLLRDYEAWRASDFQPYARVMTRPGMRWVAAKFEKRAITNSESHEAQWLDAAEGRPDWVRFVHSRRDLILRKHKVQPDEERPIHWHVIDATALPPSNFHLRVREEILRQLVWTRWLVGKAERPAETSEPPAEEE